jgi:cytidyltransferase-related domain
LVTVITYGSFDLFHEGHYRLLQRAKALGDYLIVGVTTESYDESRGKLNIVDSLVERIDHVRSTGFADQIIIEESIGQKVQDIQRFRVDIFTVGSDWAGNFDYLNEYCKVVYLERTKNISSTMLRAKNYKILRMGIIGTGRIASRFIPEAKQVSGLNVQSVYNPNKESSKKFAEHWDLEMSADLGGLLESSDAVYIATPHETHYGYAKAALERGIHVLCEKPLTLQKSQAEDLFAISKERGCVLMEAVKTAYCPGFNQMLGIARSGVIGNIRDIDACFTKLEDPSKRELNDLKYGGSFTELASYTLLPMIKLFGCNFENVIFSPIKGKNGLDLYTRALFKYSNGMAVSKCGLGVKSEGQLIISGTTGYILVEAPWWKTAYFEVRHEDSSDIEKYSFRYMGGGMRYEVSDFVSSINGNSKKDFKLTAGESIAMAGIMERFLKENRDI